ncbi:unnamed protein product [Aspergillus oryzae var. brunneus]|nr:unnamed protein product [Aspergillus oryzae var. brunneus]
MHTVPNRQLDPTPDGVEVLEYAREPGDGEGQQHKEQISNTPDSDQDVEYLYLNFDTTLPHPVGITSPQPEQASPPPCPNLTKYASPFMWAESRKTVVTVISCCVTAMSAYAAGSYTPPADELTAKWNVSRVQTGAVFAAVSIGALLATPLSIYQEKFAMRIGKMSSTPEGRLYFTCAESILLPIGLFWFGWTSFSSVPWIVPTIAVGCSTIGIFSIYLAAFNYLADTYHRYASSAIAAQSFCSSRLYPNSKSVILTVFRSKCYGGRLPTGYQCNV